MSKDQNLLDKLPLSKDGTDQVLNNKKVWYTIGIASGVFAALLVSRSIFKQISKPVKTELQLLNELINQERIKSEAIVNLNVTERVYSEHDSPSGKVGFSFMYMENLVRKLSNSNYPHNDPFHPPFEEGIFIKEISEQHNLLFNRFCVVPNHVLITTKNFEEQTNPLNNHDFAATYKVVRSLEGFAFYNSGPLSGYSQKHKHIQAMPYDKIHGYDIFKRITKEAAALRTDKRVFKCSLFKFAHRVGVIPKFRNQEDYEHIGKVLEGLYKELLKGLKIEDTKKDSYNLVMTDKWILVVKRKQEMAYGFLSVNSVGFAGTFLFKDKEKMKSVLDKDPFELLEQLCEQDDEVILEKLDSEL